MTVTLHSTSMLVTLDGVPARAWEGETESGIPVIAFITRIAVARGLPTEQFARELVEHRVPGDELAAFPRRMIL